MARFLSFPRRFVSPSGDQDIARLSRQVSALVELGLEPVAPVAEVHESAAVGDDFKTTETRPAMGTLVSISTFHSSETQAQNAIGHAFEEMVRLIDIFNRYESSTALGQLNEIGRLKDSPPELSEVVAQSLHFHRVTLGTFEMTVEPLVDLFRSRQPSRRELSELLELVGSENVELDGQRIEYKRAGMGVTLDGIAKGYIVDKMSDVLSLHGVADFLINAGGEIRTAGTKDGELPWTVAVQDPAKRENFPDKVLMNRGAIATSGSYEIFFDQERRFHHLVDAETGESPQWSVSVSVMAPTTLAADALATSLFMMAPQEGLQLIDSLAGCECLIIDHQGRQLRSRGWKSAKSSSI